MITLHLARHGQTEENLAHIFQGHLPGTLTEEGKNQARELGEKLSTVPLDAIISSDLKRTTDTVKIAMGKRDIPWATTPLLREIDWGVWTGLRINSVDTNRPPQSVETVEQLYERAGNFLQFLHSHYEGKRVLVVGHGQINRCIQAHILRLGTDRLRTIPHMENAEMRTFILPDPED